MVKNSMRRLRSCKPKGPTRASGLSWSAASRSGAGPLHLAAGGRARDVVRILGHGRQRHATVLEAGRELAVVATLARRLDEQGQVRAPVPGDHRIGARGLDLGDIRSEVAHLRERDQLLTDDLDVGALPLQVFLRVLRDLLAMRVVLVEE